MKETPEQGRNRFLFCSAQVASSPAAAPSLLFQVRSPPRDAQRIQIRVTCAVRTARRAPVEEGGGGDRPRGGIAAFDEAVVDYMQLAREWCACTRTRTSAFTPRGSQGGGASKKEKFSALPKAGKEGFAFFLSFWRAGGLARARRKKSIGDGMVGTNRASTRERPHPGAGTC